MFRKINFQIFMVIIGSDKDGKIDAIVKKILKNYDAEGGNDKGLVDFLLNYVFGLTSAATKFVESTVDGTLNSDVDPLKKAGRDFSGELLDDLLL